MIVTKQQLQQLIDEEFARAVKARGLNEAPKGNAKRGVGHAAMFFVEELDAVMSQAEEVVEQVREDIRAGNGDIIRSIDWSKVSPEAVLAHSDVQKALLAHVASLIDHLTYMNDGDMDEGDDMKLGLEGDELDEKTPPGGEKVVKVLKKQKGVKNPWAVAWSMKNKGEF